jgi:hypothetical protein
MRSAYARSRRPSAAGSAVAAGLAALAVAAPAEAASIQNVDPPSSAALIERLVTVRWDIDTTGCDPGKTAVTQVQFEIDGQLGPQALPEPAETGLNAGLFAAAAADGFRFTVNAVNVRTDGRPSTYRWRATLDCTGPGIPPDPTAVPIHVEGPWSSFTVTRVGSSPSPPGQGPGTPTPPTPGVRVPPATKPPSFGPRGPRITAFLGWAPRNRPLPVPFSARQIPRPLTPVGRTIADCRRGPRGLLLVFRHAGIAAPRPIAWTWRLDGRDIVGGRGVIGVRGSNLFHVWLGRRDAALANGVYTVSMRLGARAFGTASVRRAC